MLVASVPVCVLRFVRELAEDIKREQDNMEAAESLDVNASIHGNWTIENAKSKLNQWLQHHKIKAEFKYTSIGPDHAK